MFNKTILRNTFVLPPYVVVGGGGAGAGRPTQVCVLKATATSANPVVVNPNAVDQYGKLIYKPHELVTIFTKAATVQTFDYTFTVRAYVQSYNFLRIMGGIGNVVFSS